MSSQERKVRYTPDEKPVFWTALGLAFQNTLLTISGTVITASIVMKMGNVGETYLSWAIFAGIIISGTTTMIQASPVRRVGSGYILLMGSSGAFIAISIAALKSGGPALLSVLIVISSLFQFALSSRLSLFRNVFTPTVAGIVIMLIAVTVMPIAFSMLNKTPSGAPPMATPLSALATFLVTVVIALKATGRLRLWSPLIGIAAGSMVAFHYGIYDVDGVRSAPWFGLPPFSEWPGFDLSFGLNFWAFLPAFVFVTLIGAIETIGDSIAIQQVSWRKPRVVNYREVQGAVAADGLGNLLSGVMGTVSNTTYSSSVSILELTGIASRRVGIFTGGIFVVVAFFPKVQAFILGIPESVAATYIFILIAVLFALGLKMVVQDYKDYRQGVIVGLSFWVGLGFENKQIFPEHLGTSLEALLGNGMTMGGLTAITLTLLVGIGGARTRRFKSKLDIGTLGKVKDFLTRHASERGWKEDPVMQVHLVAEETLMGLMGKSKSQPKHLLLFAKCHPREMNLEFVVSSSDENLESRLALLSNSPDTSSGHAEEEISLKILKGMASSIRHQQYHDTDIITMTVKPQFA